jgi:putative acetyltransferase
VIRGQREHGEVQQQLCRELGHHIVVLLGHRDSYRRFGFCPVLAAKPKSLFSGKPSFMAVELVPGALDSVVGKAVYLPPFTDL